MSLINHYSILWGFAIVLIPLAFFLLRDGAKKKDFIILGGVAVLCLGTLFLIGPEPGSKESASALREQIGQGQPVLLELQSPFWAACAAAQPIVDGLEEEFADELLVFRVNVQAKSGKDFAKEFGSFTPTFVFLSADGEELWRCVGTLDPEEVRMSLDR